MPLSERVRQVGPRRANSVTQKHPTIDSPKGKRLGGRTAFEQLKLLLRRKRLRHPLELGEDHILSILMARRGREEIFGRNLFSDPAWDILLELYAAHLGERRMSVADLTRTIDSPASTVARWVHALAEHDLVTSERPEREFHRGGLALTEKAVTTMKRLAEHWASGFLSIG